MGRLKTLKTIEPTPSKSIYFRIFQDLQDGFHPIGVALAPLCVQTNNRLHQPSPNTKQTQLERAFQRLFNKNVSFCSFYLLRRTRQRRRPSTNPRKGRSRRLPFIEVMAKRQERQFLRVMELVMLRLRMLWLWYPCPHLSCPMTAIPMRVLKRTGF